jgi:hypothetical protein
MKKTLCVILCIIVGTQIYAQKIYKNEYDKFTKIRRIETSHESIGKTFGSGAMVWLDRIIDNSDSTDFLYINFSFNIGSVISVRKGSDIMLLMADETPLVLKNSADTKVYVSSDQPKVYAVLKPEIKDEILKQKIKGVRFYTSEGYYENMAKEAQEDVLLRLFSVMQQAKID